MPTAPGKWTGRIARATMVVALLVLLAGPATKFGLLPWQAGLGIFALAALLAGIGGLYSVVSLLRRRGGLVTVIAAAAGVAALAVLMTSIVSGRAVPPINDITTDPDNPPEFIAITAATRGADAGPLSYDPGFAAQQTAAYPDVRPLLVALPPAEVFPQDARCCRGDGLGGRFQRPGFRPHRSYRHGALVGLQGRYRRRHEPERKRHASGRPFKVAGRQE